MVLVYANNPITNYSSPKTSQTISKGFIFPHFVRSVKIEARDLNACVNGTFVNAILMSCKSFKTILILEYVQYEAEPYTWKTVSYIQANRK